MSTNDTPMSFEDIDVSGVQAAPSFSNPPSGQFLVKVTMDQKLVAEKRAVVVDMELVEVLAIGTQHTELPADPGQKFNALYFCDKPERIPYVKRDLEAFLTAIGTQSINTMVAAVKDMPVKIVWAYDRNDYPRVMAFEIV